jgi:hypothetical protein
MTRGIRYFLTGSALVVFLGLSTGLVAYYNGGLPIGPAKSNGDLTFVPADATAVAFADVRAIMASDFRQKLRQVLPTGEELSKFRDELGVDIERDIDTVTAAYIGGQSTPESGVVIVRGRFNTGQIEALATQHGAAVEDYKGMRLLSMATGNTTETTAHPVATVAFLNGGALALGEASAVKKAIDANASGDDVRKNAEMMDMINGVTSTGNAWIVGRFDAMANQAGLPAEIASHLPPVNLFAASVHVNGGLSGMVRAEARDDKAAEQLRDVVRGALAAGKLMTGQNPKMDSMLNSMQITGSGKTVGLTFTVPAELLELLNGVAAAHQLGTGTTIHK